MFWGLYAPFSVSLAQTNCPGCIMILRMLPCPTLAYSPPLALTRFITTPATAFMPFSPSPPASHSMSRASSSRSE